MEDWLPIIEMMMRKERLCENVSAISRHNWMSAVIKQNGNRYLGHKIYEFLNSKFCSHECSQNISILLVSETSSTESISYEYSYIYFCFCR